ncbi:MAG: alpha/beta hydrolase [Sandaracinaceae bacterium]
MEKAFALCSGVALCVALVVQPTVAQPPSDWVQYRRVDVDTPWGPQRVLLSFPRRPDHRLSPPGRRYPMVIALHGRGEALVGPERGYLAWAVRYLMPNAFEALARNRLSQGDYRTLVRPEHLRSVNARLRSQPYRGVVVVTPYVPDLSGEELGAWDVTEYADWLAGPLVDAIRARFDGVAQTREGLGIDGVSLGGRVALEAGFRHPTIFGAVGASQPAIRGMEPELAALASTSVPPQHIRLLTSDDDPFLWATRRLSLGLREHHVNHTLTTVPGPHDYIFNRGPGVLEMLLFHDRALVRETVEE